MKIFIGTEEIASILTDLTDGFRSSGHEVTTYVTSQSKFYSKNKYDIIRGQFFNDIFQYQKWKILPGRIKGFLSKIDDAVTIPYLKFRNRKLIKTHDVFVFIWRTWVPEKYLLPLLKKNGKKIICIHVGTDVRHISAFEQEYNISTKDWEAYFQNDPLNPKIERIRYQELYADLIYSLPDQAGLYLRNYDHLWLPLSKSKNIVFNIPARKVPLIIHAPSRSGIKGTTIINDTMDRLKQEGFQFEYKLIQNMDNRDLLKLLTDADILCDELYLHGPGVLSAEAMAAGCTVATRCLDIDPFHPPVCIVTPENVYEKMKLLITDMAYRVGLAEQGKKFVDEFNDPKRIATDIIAKLNSDNRKGDYTPNFFIEQYILPAGTQLNDTVKNLTSLVVEKEFLTEKAKTYKLKERGLL